MSTGVYFTALAIAFVLGFLICLAVFADRIREGSPSASHNNARDAIPPLVCSCGKVVVTKVLDSSGRLFYKCKCGNTAPVA